MVIRPEDLAAGRVICNAQVDRPNGTTQQAALNAVRRVLRVEDWFVDLDHHCIIPKHTGDYCYGTHLGHAHNFLRRSSMRGHAHDVLPPLC